MLSCEACWQTKFLSEVELGFSTSGTWPSFDWFTRDQKLLHLLLSCCRYLWVEHLARGDHLLLLGVVELLHLLRVNPLAHGRLLLAHHLLVLLLLLLLLLLVDEVDLHLLLLHLEVSLLLSGSWHCFSTLRAHSAATAHMVLNLLGMETVDSVRLVVHIIYTAAVVRLISVVFL